MHKLLHLLRLMRIELVLSAISDGWLIIFLAYALEPSEFRNEQFAAMSIGTALALGAVVAAGLAAYGLAINDVLDVRHDRAFSPHRPIPAGGIQRVTALSIAVLALLAAMAAAALLGRGSALLAGLTAVGILFYNTTARFLPALAIFSLVLVRMLGMFIPNPELGFAWPIWVNMTHATITAAIACVLIARPPRMQPRHWWMLCAAWVFWTLALFGWMSWRSALFIPGQPIIWLGPAAATGVFIVAAACVLRGARSLRTRRHTGAAFSRLALLWLVPLNASWLFAAGLYWQAMVIFSLFALGLPVTWLLGAAPHAGDRPLRYRVRTIPS